jgi:hypothetical protein
MKNGPQPLLLTILGVTLGVAALLVLQPYSADWPGMGYTKPAKRYIQAALRLNSVWLARLSASDSPPGVLSLSSTCLDRSN